MLVEWGLGAGGGGEVDGYGIRPVWNPGSIIDLCDLVLSAQAHPCKTGIMGLLGNV